MNSDSELAPLHPPADVLDFDGWQDVRRDDPLVHYFADRFKASSEQWQVTRLLGAAYAYRHRTNGSQVVAKFYAVKTQLTPEHFAELERRAMERARQVLGDAVPLPLAQWRGVLLLPFVAGLTLENVIAVRRSQVGQLGEHLVQLALLLAKLHAATADAQLRPDFSRALAYGRKMVANLAEYGALQSDPLIRQALEQLLSRWAERPIMHDFVPAFVHGDVTTGNFIFTSAGQIVALDWEGAKVGDPAQDLGRLAAEVTYSITQNGGTVHEALPLIEQLTSAYCTTAPSKLLGDALRTRAGYYRAISSLRMARNEWTQGQRRTALVAQALALLSTV